jgi:hypothetical protein
MQIVLDGVCSFVHDVFRGKGASEPKRNTMNTTQINAETSITTLRAHVVRCGLSASWFDLNVVSLDHARAYALIAMRHSAMYGF